MEIWTMKSHKKHSEPEMIFYPYPLNTLQNIIFNFRDLNQTTLDKNLDGPIKPGLIFRSSAITRAPISLDQAESAVMFLKDVLKIHTIIDLRSHRDIPDSPVEDLLNKEYPTHHALEYNPQHKKKLMIPLVNFEVKLRGYFWTCVKKNKLCKVMKAAFEQDNQPVLKRVSKVFVLEVVNEMGLVGMNKCILEYSKSSILQIFKTLLVVSNYPILIHCASGKDRTGLIVALIMSCCGISDELTFESYSLSDRYLFPILDIIIQENRSVGMLEGFDSTPKCIMEKTFKYIRKHYGSIKNYLVNIGFSIEDQNQLKKILSGQMNNSLSLSE